MPTAEWRKNNPEKQKALARASNARRWARVKDDPDVKAKNSAKTRAWYQKNRERALLQKRADYARPEVRARRQDNALKNLYGITAAQKDDLFNRQGRKCAICKTADGSRWDVDHCHSSGSVRGILCSSCNLMLGHGRDDPEILTSAIEYLKR